MSLPKLGEWCLRQSSRLGAKIVAAMLVVAVIPLLVSVFLVGQVIRVSDSVAEGQARRLVQPISKGAQGYRLLFAQTKQAFRLQAEQIARDRALIDLATRAPPVRSRVEGRLRTLLIQQPRVARLSLKDQTGVVMAQARAKRYEKRERYRFLRVRRRLGASGLQLEALFAADRAPFDDFEALGAAQRAATEITSLRAELATYYRVAFILMFGAALVVATALSLMIARRTVRRVEILAAATRTVAAGDLATRVDLQVRDELGQLAESFNEMVNQLRASSERVAYLEKISAWQEVARRLAHEIKNPLTPIQLAVQQLQRRYEGEDQGFAQVLSEACEIVTEEVGALRRLVGEFSAFSKLPAAQLEPIEVNTLVDDFCKSYSELVERASVHWLPLPGSCVVRADRMLLKHVLYNLLDNALNVHQDSGCQRPLEVTISMQCSDSGQHVTIAVEDNGPGMDADTATRVFDPYFTKRSGGTGLGLAIVKKIVLEHGGSISVSSTEGAGACFTLRLPISPSGERSRLTS